MELIQFLVKHHAYKYQEKKPHIKLNSVGCVLGLDDLAVYPQKDVQDFDQLEATPLLECSDEWYRNLSNEDQFRIIRLKGWYV